MQDNETSHSLLSMTDKAHSNFSGFWINKTNYLLKVNFRQLRQLPFSSQRVTMWHAASSVEYVFSTYHLGNEQGQDAHLTRRKEHDNTSQLYYVIDTFITPHLASFLSLIHI